METGKERVGPLPEWGEVDRCGEIDA